MPGITFKASKRVAVAPYDFGNGARPNSPEDVLRDSWERQYLSPIGTIPARCKELLGSSLPKDPKRLANFVPRANGFVDTVLKAYNRHHNLIIRPDDLWIAILSQLNLYVNAHSEELRKFFVQHEGKKELVLIYGGATRYTLDFDKMAQNFAGLLEENINDPAFYDFVLPDFSTTEPNDKVICSIIMMSVLKSYFNFTSIMLCGIPEITLLGTKDDYLNILQRIENLSKMEMGDEPVAFAKLLKPIIKEFIAVFDAVESCPISPKINRSFWGRICHSETEGSGSKVLCGWITAFCVWDKKGRWCGPDLKTLRHDRQVHAGRDRVHIAGMDYPVIPLHCVPPGFCEADVRLIDNGEELSCVVVAGHVATEAVETEVKEGKNIMGNLRPAPQWFMFEKEKVVTKRKKISSWMRPYLEEWGIEEDTEDTED